MNNMSQIGAAKRLGNKNAAKPQWKKIEAGLYESPDGEWRAKANGPGAVPECRWRLLRRQPERGATEKRHWEDGWTVVKRHNQTLNEAWSEIARSAKRAIKQAERDLIQAEEDLRRSEALCASLYSHGGEGAVRAQIRLIEEHLDNLDKLPFREALQRLKGLKTTLGDALLFSDEGIVPERGPCCTTYRGPHTVESLKATVTEKLLALEKLELET